jgi:2'-5' RNA ligase
VLWVGLAEGVAPLTGLARELEVELVARGFEAEARPFHPHLTVARARPGPLHDLRGAAAAPGGAAIGSQRVDGIVVVESTLGPGGPSYLEVSRAALGE